MLTRPEPGGGGGTFRVVPHHRGVRLLGQLLIPLIVQPGDSPEPAHERLVDDGLKFLRMADLPQSRQDGSNLRRVLVGDITDADGVVTEQDRFELVEQVLVLAANVVSSLARLRSPLILSSHQPPEQCIGVHAAVPMP